MFTVAFPGIGIENFSINRVAFTLPIFGGVDIYWSGIVIALAIILAGVIVSLFIKREGFSVDDILDMAIWGILCGMVGARLFYVLGAPGQFKSFYDVIAIWEGGLSIFGAMLFGGLAIYAVCRHKKLSAMRAFDMLAPALLSTHILGRVANFLNAESYGVVVDEKSILYGLRMGLQEEGWKKMTYHYPVLFFEVLWNLIGILPLLLLYKKKKFDGQVFLLYISWYGFGRLMLEGLRIDSLKIGVFRLSQIAGMICFAVGMILLITKSIKARRTELTAQEYVPAYGKFRYGAATEEAISRAEQKNADSFDAIASMVDSSEENDGEEDEDDEDDEIYNAEVDRNLNRLFEDDK